MVPKTSKREQVVVRSGIARPYKTEDETTAIYDQLCAVEIMHNNEVKNKPVEHHVFEGNWVARHSKPHSVMRATLTFLPDDHEQLGHPLSTSNPTPAEK